jgi:ABC-type transporter Mla MlaB component
MARGEPPTRGAPPTISFAVRGPLTRSDLPGLCERVRALLAASGARRAFCDVRDVEPDAVAVDALARLQLAAKRYGCRVLLCHPSSGLLDLVTFMGLRDVLPCWTGRAPPMKPIRLGRRPHAR